MSMSDTINIRFRAPHGAFLTTDVYAFPSSEADRYIAAGLAVEDSGNTLAPAEKVAEAKRSGARAVKITKG
jgi:hypothetical protein